MYYCYLFCVVIGDIYEITTYAKKIFPLFLWFFVSVFSLSILYVIGVLRNWTDTTTVLYWIFVILVTLSLKLLVDCIRNYFLAGKYRHFIMLFFRKKRTLMLDSYFSKGLKIIRKKEEGKSLGFYLQEFQKKAIP